jgi:hypothetical protein
VRAAARCEIAGVESAHVAVRAPAPAAVFKNALRSMTIVFLFAAVPIQCFVAQDNGEPDMVAPQAEQHALENLPVEVLVYLFDGSNGPKSGDPRDRKVGVHHANGLFDDVCGTVRHRVVRLGRRKFL